MPSCPAAAASGRPSTGAQTMLWFACACAALSAWMAATLCVPMHRCTAPGASESRTPPLPSVTSLTAVSSDTIVMTTSRPRHTSATDDAIERACAREIRRLLRRPVVDEQVVAAAKDPP